MKNLFCSFVVIFLFSCQKQKQENVVVSEIQALKTIDKLVNSDSILNYHQIDERIYHFDTIINQVSYDMKAYCLNDSAVYNQTYGGKLNETQKEYMVAHNYAANFKIKTNKSESKFTINKVHFKDSLPDDFIKIATMWKNEFSHVENGKPIFCATLAQPDTDYQFSIYYGFINHQTFQILRVNDDGME